MSVSVTWHFQLILVVLLLLSCVALSVLLKNISIAIAKSISISITDSISLVQKVADVLNY